MKRRRACLPDRDELREDLLRPHPRLGYDRDQIGVHLSNREAHGAAEAQLRRAVWLNPYEPMFKQHLAVCFLRQKKFHQALLWIRKAISQDPGNAAHRRIEKLIRESLQESQRSGSG